MNQHTCLNFLHSNNKIMTILLHMDIMSPKFYTTNQLLNGFKIPLRCQLFALNDFSKTARRILKKNYMKVPWVTLYQNCSNLSAPLNKMATRAKNRKTLKRLLLLNQKMDFEIITQECFLGDPLPKLLKRFR